MAISKSYLKTKNVCRVTFKIPAPVNADVRVVGDFNEWSQEATPMKKSKDGYSATIDLEPGREYQFRYLIDGTVWENDNDCDGSAETPFQDAKNSVVLA